MTSNPSPAVSVVELSTANPAPLGLCAFGMTTVLLNIHNAGFFPMNSMIFAMGIFYGGIAQVIAGIMEARKNNTFGFTAFTSVGLFWLSLVALLIMAKLNIVAAADNNGMAAYFAIWALFTGLLFISTLRLNIGLQVIFGSLTLLFVLLVAGELTGSAGIKTTTGYEGILCGLSVIYVGTGQVTNEIFGRRIFPFV